MMQLRLASNPAIVVSNRVDWFEGWRVRRGKKKELETTNNVTYTQIKGRREWIANVAFKFSDLPGFEYSTIQTHMPWFQRWADNGEFFYFTDRWGDTFIVHPRNDLVPERDEESPLHPVFIIEADLMVKGFE